MQHPHPVSNNEPKGPIPIFSLLSFSQTKERKVPSHTSLPGGKGGDNGVDQASFKEGSPCRAANDKKAKLPKSEQLVLIFKLSSSNDSALCGKPVRGGTNSWLDAPLLCFESAQQLKCAATSRDKVSCRSGTASRLPTSHTQRSRLGCLRRQVP